MGDDTELAFFAGTSRLAALMRSHDWSRSGLGAPAHWPQSLRSIVHLMLGSAFPMFVAWGPSLNTLYNDAYAQIMGDKHPRGLGRPFLEIWAEIHDDLYPLTLRALGGEAFYMENLPLRMRRHGYDEDTWFTFSWSPVIDEAGQTAGIYCACTETTRMVLAERRLRAREEWLQGLFDQAPGFAAVVKGPDHVFEMANAAYLDVTGNRELIGLPLARALPEFVEQGFAAQLDDVLRTGVAHVGRSVEVHVNQPDGGPPVVRHVDFMYQPLRDAEGQVQGVFVQGNDVTEQHRAQEALRQADRNKDEFLATLAHELRNPLAPIRTAAHLLARPGVAAAKRDQATGIILRQVVHMSRLLDDLIDIARITQGRLLLRKDAVPLDSVVDAALEAVRPLAQAKHHALERTVTEGALPVVVDPVRMAQVLTNLLGNAIKYTDPGGRIRIDASIDGARMHFVVTDNGIGLSPQAQQNLFVMFAQDKAALDRSEGGLGIGLALVKALVELHGGTVSATSEGQGRGSRFDVWVPVGVSADPPVPADAARRPDRDAAATPLVMVLADDNRDACVMLAELLRLQGHVVHTAHDGVEAVALAEKVRPDVLVLDIGMPGLNGYEVARELRAAPWGSAPLLVAATGWSQTQDRERALAAGFDAHLTKPFDPTALDELLARRRAESPATSP
jgi:signal transduction histidine kinase/CheY-like chemotaxis protein